jgi:copper chaperone
MGPDSVVDQLAVIRIQGMHCHHCEMTIQKKLSAISGVREVEVDFNSGQASVLFDRVAVSTADLVRAVQEAGYQANLQ